MAGEATLPPIRANVGLQKAYQARLDRLIDAMSKSVIYWVEAQYRRNPPELAEDASPARDLIDTIRKLKRRWLRQFDEGSADLARYFATASKDRTDAALKLALRKAGISVRMQMTPAMNDAFQAVAAENVSLIKSIPEQYFTQVEGAVMRSVAKGGDLAEMSRELHDRYGVTKRRAALISRDQNRKASAVMARARYLEIGIEQAIWVHSAGGHTQRKSHVAASVRKHVYNVREGWLDPDVGRLIQPGELINCKCSARPVIPGLTPKAP
jgi:uncharacterized protein with gpF-like domain